MLTGSLWYQSSFDTLGSCVFNNVGCKWTVRNVCRRDLLDDLPPGEGRWRVSGTEWGITLHLLTISNAVAIVHFVHCTFDATDDGLDSRECEKERSTDTCKCRERTKTVKNGIYIWNKGTLSHGHLLASSCKTIIFSHIVDIGMTIQKDQWYFLFLWAAQWLMRYTSTYIKVHHSSPTHIAYCGRWSTPKGIDIL